MCGFVMILSADGRSPDSDMPSRMAELIAHRGPDDAGAFSEHGVAFAFRRLAIFDLTESSNQPMIGADGRYAIVFNGAIFNFIELRAELSKLGHTFRTTGDTEVLLAAYRQWGTACLPRLNGMCAFVIYDRQTRRIFAARDRFGIKPLFWYHDARGLVLTSEIKAIRDSGYAQSAPNWRTVASFLLEDRLDANDETFYSGIHRAPAGCFFEGDGGAAPQFRRYWNLEEAAEALDEPANPVEEFRQLFDDAVRLRMRSDVPVGVLLSGGLDSTSIISSMTAQFGQTGSPTTRLHALCYHDPAYDERELIDATLAESGVSLSRLEPDPERLWNSLDRHLWHQDEPVQSFTSVVSYQLMQLARERGVKVVLNGQGADEVLAGYPTSFIDYWSDLVRSGRPRLAHNEIKVFARSHEQSTLALHGAVARTCFNHLKRHVPGHGRIAARNRRARIASNQWVSNDIKRHWQPDEEPYARTLPDSLRLSVERSQLPLYLRVEDRNSMAHAVEVRLPFLDHRLVALAFRLGPQWKLSGEYTKVVLRRAMQGRIPESVRTRVKKFGFPTSQNRWFRTVLYERCRDLLASRTIRESGVWNVPELDRALDRHQRGAADLGGRLFDIAQFGMWLGISRFCLLWSFLAPGLAQFAELGA